VRERLVKTEIPKMKSETGAFVELFFENLTQRLASDPNAPDIDPKLVAFIQNVSIGDGERLVDKTQAATKDQPLPAGEKLIILAPAEAFIAYMKISLIAGLILTSPWVFYQIWMFVAAGLYESERKYVRTAIPFSTGLFVIGALFFLFVIAPVTLRFFLGFGDIVGVASNWTLSKYISFVTILMLVFGVAFQTPIAVLILVRTGLVSIKTLRSTASTSSSPWPFVSAVATPSPDPFSMLALLIPLWGLLRARHRPVLLRRTQGQQGQAAVRLSTNRAFRTQS